MVLTPTAIAKLIVDGTVETFERLATRIDAKQVEIDALAARLAVTEARLAELERNLKEVATNAH